MSSQLYTLTGSPLTWEELHARREAWWKARELEVVYAPSRSAACAAISHSLCSGRMAKQLVNGHGVGGYISCGCICHRGHE